MRLAVLICASIGLLLVARAAAFYRSTDQLSYTLALLIAAGLVAGTVEVYLRASRAARWLRELDSLRHNPTSASVDNLSHDFRSIVRAKLDGAPAPVSTAVFTPYLLGLLVMLGMLGTFLGLFESLRGAREALTTGGDIDALRSALASPMQGLSRAFGLSAAGVSASATLGLAAVFARRAEATLLLALGTLLAGPLAPLTLRERELAALEQMASHGRALPAAAQALEVMVERLSSLESTLGELQARSTERSVDAIRTASSDLQSHLAAALDTATRATTTAVQPFVRSMVDGAAAAAREHLDSWSDRLENDAVLRAEGERAHLERVSQLLLEHGNRIEGDAQARAAKLEQSVAQLVASVDAPMRELVEAEQQRTAYLSQRSEQVLAELGHRAAVSDQQLQQSHERSQREEAQRAAAFGALVDQLGARLGESITANEQLERSQLDALAAMIDRVTVKLEATAANQQAEHRRTSAALAESLSALVLRVEGLVEAGVRNHQLQEQASERTIETLAHKLDAVVQNHARAQQAQADTARGAMQGLQTLMRQALDGHRALQLAQVQEMSGELQRLRASVAQIAETHSASQGGHLRALEGAVVQMQSILEASAERSAGAEARRLEVLARAQRSARADSRRALTATRLATSSIASKMEGLGAALERLEQRSGEHLRGQSEGMAAALARQLEQVHEIQNEQLSAMGQAMQGLEAAFRQQLEALGSSLAQPLRQVTETARQAPEAALRLIELQASRLEAAHAREIQRDASIEAMLARMKAAAESVAELGSNQQTRIEGLAATLERMMTRTDERTAQRLSQVIELLREASDQHAQRLAAFEGTLELSRQGGAEALADRLGAHTQALALRLDQTAAVVTEAAHLVRGGGAEMSAVSEMFLAAVDRYREASDRVLAVLGPTEDASDRTGRGDAADVLGTYLDQTREVFESTLHFQRELFTELRALKRSAAGGAGARTE